MPKKPMNKTAYSAGKSRTQSQKTQKGIARPKSPASPSKTNREIQERARNMIMKPPQA